MEIYEADLIQAMRWHEIQTKAKGDAVDIALPGAVAALAEPLYTIWGTNRHIDVSALSRKAVQSLNDYWLGVGSPLKINIEQYPIETDDPL